MQKLISISSFFVLFFASCRGPENNPLNSLKITDTSTSFKKEIPTYKDGPRKGDTEYLFKAIRQDAAELGLDFIENGFDTLQIRVWLGHSMAVKRNVVILKNVNGQWFGQLVTYSYGHSEKDGKEFISKKEIKPVNPKSGWQNFVNRVMRLQITTLPNGQDIRDYNSCGGADGIDYFFETATRRGYRFYYYCNPEENVNQFWQVKNALEFSGLLEKEFDFTYIR